MRWFTHLSFGLLLFLILSKLFGISGGLVALVVCALASILPDIDEPKSKIGKKVWPISAIIKLLLKHRGLMHSLAMLIFLSAICFLVSSSIAFWFAVGYTSHLILDSFTPSGIAWLAPLSKRRLRAGIKTGGILEKIVLVLVWIIIIIILLKQKF